MKRGVKTERKKLCVSVPAYQGDRNTVSCVNIFFAGRSDNMWAFHIVTLFLGPARCFLKIIYLCKEKIILVFVNHLGYIETYSVHRIQTALYPLLTTGLVMTFYKVELKLFHLFDFLEVFLLCVSFFLVLFIYLFSQLAGSGQWITELVILLSAPGKNRLRL